MNSTDNTKWKLLRERQFAQAALSHYEIYLYLEARETDPHLRSLFSELAAIAKEEFSFWGTKISIRGDQARASMLALVSHRILRKLLGVTLTTHVMINRERTKLRHFNVYCVNCIDNHDRKAIEIMIARSLALVPASEDPRFKFFSFVVLGFNDALIELVGALVGFSFALQNQKMVTVAALVSAITAAASIAASAYLEAEHETGKDPHRAAFYSGVAYFGTASLLVAPFIISGSLLIGNIVMLLIALGLILILALYSSVAIGKSYLVQLREIAFLSLGVAFVSFSVGFLLNMVFLGTV